MTLSIDNRPSTTSAKVLCASVPSWAAAEVSPGGIDAFSFTSLRSRDIGRLYDLADDLGETTDVAAEHPTTVRQLRDAWFAWEQDVEGGFQ